MISPRPWRTTRSNFARVQGTTLMGQFALALIKAVLWWVHIPTSRTAFPIKNDYRLVSDLGDSCQSAL